MPHSALTNDKWEGHSARVEANLIKDRTKLASAKFQKQHTYINYNREKIKSFLNIENLTFILEPLHRNTCFGKGIASSLKFFYFLELVVFGPLLDGVIWNVRKLQCDGAAKINARQETWRWDPPEMNINVREWIQYWQCDMELQNSAM